MRKNNRKGFTIVELVIVIAVIAILAGVLIPTFAGIINKAKESAALQEAQNIYKEVYALDISDGAVDYKDGKTDDDGILPADLELTDVTFTYDAPAEGKTVFFTCEVDDYTVTFDGINWVATDD